MRNSIWTLCTLATLTACTPALKEPVFRQSVIMGSFDSRQDYPARVTFPDVEQGTTGFGVRDVNGLRRINYAIFRRLRSGDQDSSGITASETIFTDVVDVPYGVRSCFIPLPQRGQGEFSDVRIGRSGNYSPDQVEFSYGFAIFDETGNPSGAQGIIPTSD
jgi:hypothetical protein